MMRASDERQTSSNRGMASVGSLPTGNAVAIFDARILYGKSPHMDF